MSQYTLKDPLPSGFTEYTPLWVRPALNRSEQSEREEKKRRRNYLRYCTETNKGEILRALIRRNDSETCEQLETQKYDLALAPNWTKLNPMLGWIHLQHSRQAIQIAISKLNLWHTTCMGFVWIFWNNKIKKVYLPTISIFWRFECAVTLWYNFTQISIHIGRSDTSQS